jgi:hypothetical protein
MATGAIAPIRSLPEGLKREDCVEKLARSPLATIIESDSFCSAVVYYVYWTAARHQSFAVHRPSEFLDILVVSAHPRVVRRSKISTTVRQNADADTFARNQGAVAPRGRRTQWPQAPSLMSYVGWGPELNIEGLLLDSA